MKIDELRREIDKIDGELLSLYLKRLDLVDNIKKEKKKAGLEICQPKREAELLSALLEKVDSEKEKVYVENLFKFILSESKKYQSDDKFALIGKSLSHSFSLLIHKRIGLNYELKETEADNLKKLLNDDSYKGFNITIPYKEDVIPLVDEVSEEAKEIGAVNTIVRRDGKLFGYNTDVIGMKEALDRMGVDLKNKVVMVLGGGGTAKTALYLLNKIGAKKVYQVTRKGKLNYTNAYEMQDTEFIINTTPVGMYPNGEESPLRLRPFENLIGVFDAVYNPLCTSFVEEARSLNLKASTGLYMLVSQAVESAKIWKGEYPLGIDKESLYKELCLERSNIVLIGMPGAGKTSIGLSLSKLMNKTFVDTDILISKREGSPVEEILKSKGEDYFRQVEKEVIKEVSSLNNAIISTGGGAVIFENNRNLLKKNAIVVYVKRNLDFLSTEGRVLSVQEGVGKLFKERNEIYESSSDIEVCNNTELDEAVKEIYTKIRNWRF